MYLKTLAIDAFKCFERDFPVELHDGLNVLVGENGAWETCIFSAIRQLCNDSESGKQLVYECDFNRGLESAAVSAGSIRIDATYSVNRRRFHSLI